MEEAYMIGIRTLLENGASPGLAVIGRDLAAADRAISATQTGLEHLGGLARRAAMAVVPVRRAAVPRVPPAVVASVTDPLGRPPRSPVSALLPTSPKAMREAMPSPRAVVSTSAPQRGRAATSAAGRPATMVSFAAIAPKLRTSAPVSPRLRPAVSPPSMAGVPLLPAALLSALLPAASRAVEFSGFAPPATPRIGSQDRVMPMPPRLKLPPPMKTAAPRARAPGMTVRMPASPRQSESGATESPGQPPLAGRQESSGAESASSGAGGPTGGDVFLDGMRVGRWMARELGRQAGGPQAGGTAFDPRTSPAWPGALQGS